jgi:hypothetical protein
MNNPPTAVGGIWESKFQTRIPPTELVAKTETFELLFVHLEMTGEQ